MKRVLAAIAAIAMIAAGFVINNSRKSGDAAAPTSRTPLVLWCVPDAADVCNSVASTSVLVSIKTPLETEAALAKGTRIDAVVTSSAWSDRMDDRQQVKIADPLGSTPIVVASRSGETVCSDAPCVIKTDTKAALPVPATLAASIVAALGTGGRPADEIPSATVAFLQAGGAPSSGFEPLTALVQARVVNAAVTTGATAKTIPGIEIRSMKGAVLQLTLAWLVDDRRLDEVSTALKARLTTLGWDKALATVPGPDGNSTVEAYVLLNT